MVKAASFGGKMPSRVGPVFFSGPCNSEQSPESTGRRLSPFGPGHGHGLAPGGRARSSPHTCRGDYSPTFRKAIALVEVARAAGQRLTLEDIYEKEVARIKVRM